MQPCLDLSSSGSLPPKPPSLPHSHITASSFHFGAPDPEASWLCFPWGSAHRLWLSKVVIIKCCREEIFSLLYWSLNFIGRNSYSNNEAIVIYLLFLQKKAHLEIYILQYKQIYNVYLGSVCFFVETGKPIIGRHKDKGKSPACRNQRLSRSIAR